MKLLIVASMNVFQEIRAQGQDILDYGVEFIYYILSDVSDYRLAIFLNFAIFDLITTLLPLPDPVNFCLHLYNHLNIDYSLEIELNNQRAHPNLR